MVFGKQGKSGLSWTFDVIGVVMITAAIILVKLATQPLVEIIAGILATIGFGFIAGAKYV